MIDFRYHVVSIVAVFLALTVGLVLGASFLSKAQIAFLNGQITNATNAKNHLEAQQRTLAAENNHLSDYIDGTKNNLVSNQLFNASVVVVRAAGFNQDHVNATLALAKQAAATITADITVNPTFADPSSADSLQQLVADYAPRGQQIPGGDAVTQAVNLLVEALTAQATTTPAFAGSASASASPSATPTTMTPSWAVRTLQEFKAIGVINVTTMPNAANALKPTAAFIAAPEAAQADAQNALYVSLAQSLHTADVGPVIGGAAADAETGGVISAVLKNATAAKTVSTVDDMDGTIGQVAVVFVLYDESTNGTAPAGHYGMTGITDGLLPKLPNLPPVPSPSAS
ncbi:MAG TPA: copper transporter [Actinocrinis sp.]|uniref:copper transporter n=1 Tax=Actinocrinis sp. TaxID=1920516 RepID=UPI002D4EA166|nr:copper transporter [Actinocrinis sp.]HZU57816.1 copper transporter [Actinocrinis sp.]